MIEKPTDTVQAALKQEELHGAVTSNIFRYIFALMIFAYSILNTSILEGKIGIIANFLAVLAYLALAIIHTFIIRNSNEKTRHYFGYIAILGDFAIITSILLFWQFYTVPDNLAFSLKNPITALYFLPVALTIFQFRISYVLTAAILFFLTYGSLLVAAFLSGVPVTTDWEEYIFGNAIIVPDIISGRPIVYLCVALSIGYGIHRAVSLVKRIGSIEAQKAILSRYFSPEVAEEITANPDVLYAGNRQPVTILFTDIRGFTAMSENMEPENLAEYLGDFRSRMTEIIFKNQGTIDKFIGDAIMATFGTPRPSPERGMDSFHALKAATEMLAELNRFNTDWYAKGIAELKMGIGIHSGDVFAGNIGTEGRLEFSVIGDAVNTASRIESLCKKLHQSLIVSDRIEEEVQPFLAGSGFRFEKLPAVRVKGKTEPLKLATVRLS